MALPPISGGPRVPPNEARAAAQRAFFEAAGRPSPAPAATQPAATATVRAAASPGRTSVQATGATKPPDANARPGSIVDIRV